MEPNKSDILAHLTALFSPRFVHPYPDARIEVAYGAPENGPNKGEWFSAFNLTSAADFAAARNVEGNNVYVGAALRHGNAPPFGRGNDKSFLAAAHAWIDLDGAGAYERADEVAKAHNLKAAMIVTTGTVPHTRAHVYFKIDGGVTDGGQLFQINKSLRELFDSDDVANPSRVLRLAGTVSYPKRAKQDRGYIAELVTFRVEREPRSYPTALLAGLSLPNVTALAASNSSSPPNLGLKLPRTDSELLKLLQASLVEGQWHNSIRNAVATMIGREWSDAAIRLACAAYCRGGADDPDLEVIIDGGRKKWAKPDIESAAGSQPGAPLLLIRDAASFAAEYQPADYLVDGLLQTRFLYALTAQTGTGKTALALLLSQCVADGVPFAGREVKSGAVLYCAGENPDELRQRFLAMCDQLGRKPDSFNIHFLTLRTSKGLLIGFAEVEDYARGVKGGVRCVIVDTAAVFFDGEDENSNTELGDYARRLRKMADLPGQPAIIVPCHPVKNPKTREECVPRGGGAFVNEVDGNLILWPAAENTVELDWARKFRGPPFDPIPFLLRQVETKTARDAKGRPVKTVLAEPISEHEAAAQRGAEQADLQALLIAMYCEPGARTPTALAKACGWLSHAGTELDALKDKQRARTRRRLNALKDRRLAEPAAVGGGWRLTDKGVTEARRLTEGPTAAVAA